MKSHRHVPLIFPRVPPEEQLEASREFLHKMAARRSVRFISPEPVSFELIENAILCASLAPSGANQQPWKFVVVKDPAIKRKIREAAEAEERESYEHRMPAEWLEALAPLGTDWHKEFLETAPYLIVVFRVDFGLTQTAQGEQRTKHYYVQESVGIATGFLLAALHWSGLATLTHTPSPMGFLSEILERPRNERPFVLIPVGLPAFGATVPDIGKKSLAEVLEIK
ncbi:MAG: nitroreductase family protein [Acidobacteriaceae bacterium]|nr:nitroreductase family protein [Acidobacteriaceae bacterium]MBV9034490.1 nitroreductase family protein [Acidobacteriaceae bacterium]MBV9222960.1 nitroreductase family protein [Acidobacteriaceae bacterium]MBV9306383.1 nitroreductase family protein [Acidobacteriaceae bacterium]